MVSSMLKHKYLILWLISGTLLIAYILGNYYHQLGFYYPEFYSRFSMNIFKPENAEEAYDLHTLSNFILAFIVSCALAVLFIFYKKALRKNN